MKTALITGATSGIGKATAERFAKEGINLILCGRRQERLDELQNKLSTQVDVYTLNFDVRDKEKVTQAIEALPSEWKQIDILINNAGNAHGLDPIQTGSTDDWDAKEVYPNGNVYCASKHAVDAINQGMRIDLNKYNVRVGAVNPGMVATEFSEVRFKGDTDRADKVYKGFDVLKPEDIADIIYFVVSRPYHVNIADLVVMSTAQASSTIINKG